MKERDTTENDGRREARAKMIERYPDLNWRILYVHHKDGKPMNNANSNLAIIYKNDHRLIHSSSTPVADCLKAEMLVCLDNMLTLFLKVSNIEAHKRETNQYLDMKERVHSLFVGSLAISMVNRSL
jgi:hypothetical protein